jgi:hypothetical protein
MKRKRLIQKKNLICSKLFNLDSQLARGKGGKVVLTIMTKSNIRSSDVKRNMLMGCPIPIKVFSTFEFLSTSF